MLGLFSSAVKMVSRILKPAVIIVGSPVVLAVLLLTSYLYSGPYRTHIYDAAHVGHSNGSRRTNRSSFITSGQDTEASKILSGPAGTRIGSSELAESFENSIHETRGLNSNLNDNQIKSLDKLNTRLPRRRQRYLIYICGGKFTTCGGWTDRLKGIIITYLISKATNRTFGINMTYPPCDLVRYLQPNQIAWNINLSNTILKSYKKSIGYHIETNQRQFYNSINDLDFDKYLKEDIVYFQANFDYVDQFKNNSRYRSQNAWIANLTRDQVYVKLYNELFSLSPYIQTEMSVFMKLAKPTPNHKLVCAQIRVGRNPTNPKDRVIMSSSGDLLKVWDFLNKYNERDKYRIYVTSDSDEIQKEASARFSNVVDNGGAIVHIDRFTNNTRACEGLKKVIYDQQILSRCDVLLLTFSGVGRMSAYLRQTDSDLFCLVKHKIVKCRPSTLKELYHVLG